MCDLITTKEAEQKRKKKNPFGSSSYSQPLKVEKLLDNCDANPRRASNILQPLCQILLKS
jgi:hypothetical protein